MRSHFTFNSPLRIFAFSAVATIVSLLGVAFGMGWEALYIILVLMVVELTFSFDNAIINAKVLEQLSPFWQKLFLTVGIFIAIFGMRVIFPILIVSLTANLDWHTVLDLALHDPEQYAHYLEDAHPVISAFGGAFLLMLAFHFFFSDERDTLWLKRIESKMCKLKHWWWPGVVTLVLIGVVALLPLNHHAKQTLLAGGLGTLTYLVIHWLITTMEKWQGGMDTAALAKGLKRTGMAAFVSFMYLEILDASFSFDGVIGAFAITSNVVLIAIGLGVGAIWVRSMTVYMVRRKTLNNFVYLEHGAHYTVFVLAIIMLGSAIFHLPEIIPGLTGIGIIVASIAASIRVRKLEENQ